MERFKTKDLSNMNSYTTNKNTSNNILIQNNTNNIYNIINYNNNIALKASDGDKNNNANKKDRFSVNLLYNTNEVIKEESEIEKASVISSKKNNMA
jgi:hypothetical protein